MCRSIASVVDINLELRVERFCSGETWHWSVLKFELRPSGGAQGVRRGDLYADLWARKEKTRLLAQFTVRGSKQMDYPLKQVRFGCGV